MKTSIYRIYRPMATVLASVLLSLSLIPGVAAACEGGGEEKEAGGEFPTSMSISPSPYKYPKAENHPFTITDTSSFTFFEIADVTSSNPTKFRPYGECVNYTLFAFWGPKSCTEHVEFIAPFEAGKSAVLTVLTLGGNETDKLSS